ncbi:MAG: hypothetical protein LBS50_02760 [Prevotellaceae bacterium]|jgi:hypothetical protein|nr:hypothetical protein [Prevotellaceae bacterium]
MTKQTEDIKVIREMMEKSSKFQSISGLSLVWAGLFAVAGAAFAYYILHCCSFIEYGKYTFYIKMWILLADALAILALAVGIITFCSWWKAKRNRATLFSKVTLRAAYNLLIPLAAGGAFSLVLLYHSEVTWIASITLIFYGLALINASKYTVGELHILGICEVIIGLLAAIFLYHGIVFWTIGFGALHIVFGIIMQIKYR